MNDDIYIEEQIINMKTISSILLALALVSSLRAQTNVIGDNGTGCRCSSGGTGIAGQGTTVTFSSWAAADSGTQIQRLLSCHWYHNGALLPYTNTLDTVVWLSDGNWYMQYTVTNVQPSDAGAYSVTTTNNGRPWTNTFTLYVGEISNLPPSIVWQPVSLTVTQGMTATFSVVANVGGSTSAPMSYRWYWYVGGSTPVLQGTNATLTLANVQSSQAGNYAAVIANGAWSVTSLVASLTVRVPPSIVQQPVSLTVTQFSTATFSVGADGDAPLTYQWYVSGNMRVEQGTSTSLIWNSVLLRQAGNYMVVVANGVGSVTSMVASLTILVPPQSVVIQPSFWPYSDGASVAIGTDITFTDSEAQYFRWYHAGTNIPCTTSYFTITNVQPSDAGVYFAVELESGYTNDFRLYVGSKLRLEGLPMGTRSVQLLLIGNPEQDVAWYTIEYSTDFKTWRTMLDFLAPVAGTFREGTDYHLYYWVSIGGGLTYVIFPYFGGHCYYRAVANY